MGRDFLCHEHPGAICCVPRSQQKCTNSFDPISVSVLRQIWCIALLSQACSFHTTTSKWDCVGLKASSCSSLLEALIYIRSNSECWPQFHLYSHSVPLKYHNIKRQSGIMICTWLILFTLKQRKNRCMNSGLTQIALCEVVTSQWCTWNHLIRGVHIYNVDKFASNPCLGKTDSINKEKSGWVCFHTASNCGCPDK